MFPEFNLRPTLSRIKTLDYYWVVRYSISYLVIERAEFGINEPSLRLYFTSPSLGGRSSVSISKTSSRTSSSDSEFKYRPTRKVCFAVIRPIFNRLFLGIAHRLHWREGNTQYASSDRCLHQLKRTCDVILHFVALHLVARPAQILLIGDE